MEKESRYLGQIPDQDIFAGQLKPTTVFDNLTSCLFEYFDQGGGDVPAQWVQEWDGSDLRRLPAAISITMTSRGPGGNSLIRRMVVPIQAEAVDQRLNMINQFGGTPYPNRVGVTR